MNLPSLNQFTFSEPIYETPRYIPKAPSIKSFERRLDKLWANQYIKFNDKNCLKILHRNKAPFEINNRTGSENNGDEDLAIEVH